MVRASWQPSHHRGLVSIIATTSSARRKVAAGSDDMRMARPTALQPLIASAGDDRKGTSPDGRLGPVSPRIEIEGVQTRACLISRQPWNQPLPRAYAAGRRCEQSARRGPLFEVPAQEIHLLTLWVRTWGEKLEVELDVDPDTDGEGMIAGRVSCLWNDGPGGAQTPALEARRYCAGFCLSGLRSRKLRAYFWCEKPSVCCGARGQNLRAYEVI